MPTPREISRYWFVVNCPHCSQAVGVLPAEQGGHLPDIRSETPGKVRLLVTCNSCGREMDVTPEHLWHLDLDA